MIEFNILGTLLKEILKALPRIVKLSNFFISFTMEIWQKNVDGKFVVLFSYELRFINVVVLADSGFFQKRGGRIWSKSLKMRLQGFQGEKSNHQQRGGQLYLEVLVFAEFFSL